jgi:tRNA pseudouridine55 synthase
VASFGEAQAVTLETARAAAEQGGEEALSRLLLPIEAALQDLAELSVGQNDAARLLRGQPVLIRGRDAPADVGPTYATCKGQLIAVGRIERGELHPIRVFNFSDGR